MFSNPRDSRREMSWQPIHESAELSTEVKEALAMCVTIRKVPGGLLFWRSTDDDIRQAKEVANRLQSAQRGRRGRPRRRRRG
jgi:hypothetical protein